MEVQEVFTEGLSPHPPAKLIHYNKTEREVTLFWKAVIYKQKQSFYLTYTSNEDQYSEVIPLDFNQENVEHIVFNLSPGTVYEFSLWAFFGNLYERHISEGGVVQIIRTKGLPQDPVDFQLVDDTLTETTAEFCWKPGKYRKYKQIFLISYWRKGDEENTTNVTVNDTHQKTISYLVKNLQEGKQYVFCIVAQNEIGKSNISEKLFVQTKGLPDEPRNFRLVDDLLTETTATFIWESGHYRRYEQTFVISYCLEHDKHTFKEKVNFKENQITHTVIELKGGKQYDFQIRAKNKCGLSKNCKQLFVKTKGLPEDPKHFRLVDNLLTETSATFTWEPGAYRKYTQTFVILYFATKDEKHKYQERVEDTFESTITHTVCNLKEGTLYEFVVYSTNDIGDSKATDKISVETKGKPDKPSNLIASPNTPTSILISWTPGFYRRDIQSFVIKYRRVTRSSKRKWKTVIYQETLICQETLSYQETLVYQETERKQLHNEITGLQPACDYEVFVHAMNCFGESENLPIVQVSTEGLLPKPPAEFICCNIMETEVKLFWKPQIYKQKQCFYLTYTNENKDQYSEVIPFDNSLEKIEHSVCNLSHGTVYTFSLWAFFGNLNENKLSESCEIQVITTAGLPEDPVDFHLVEETLTETTAEFRWKPGKYRKYEQIFVILYWLKGDKENITDVTVNDTHQQTMSHSVNNLQAGQQYVFCIVARNNIGKSNISETVFVQTRGRPDEPRHFRLVDHLLTETSATFMWEPGQYRKYQQTFVISYCLEHDEKDKHEEEVEDEIENYFTHTVSGLKEGKQYEFEIWSKNRIGVSNRCTKLLVETKGKPDNPSNLIASPNTPTSVLIRWKPGQYRRDIQSFIIGYRMTSGSSKIKWEKLYYDENRKAASEVTQIQTVSLQDEVTETDIA